MKTLTPILLLLSIVSVTISTSAQDYNLGYSSIKPHILNSQVSILASDWMEGRGTGALGGDMAADYIASTFISNELEPMTGKNKSSFEKYFQNFPLINSEITNSDFAIIKDNSKLGFSQNCDYKIYSAPDYSIFGDFETVFAGYGICDENKKIDELAKLEVKGKVVVILEGYPGMEDTASIGAKLFNPANKMNYKYELLRAKTKNLKEKGAVAVIVLSNEDPMVKWNSNIYYYHSWRYEGDKPDNNPNSIKLRMVSDNIQNSPALIYVSERLKGFLEESLQVNLTKYAFVASGNPHKIKPDGKSLSLHLSINVNSEIIKSKNVLGIIKGEIENEYVIVGAHYDHVGKFKGEVYNGADDNASGTAGVISLARAFSLSGLKPKRSIIFAAWGAEEKGLYGSEFFVKSITLKNSKVYAYINFDMIGRDEENDTLRNKASLGYTSAYPFFAENSRQFVSDSLLNLNLSYKGYVKPTGGSDFAPFADANFPVCYFMAGWHKDYHTPEDEVNKINFIKMSEIVKLAYNMLWKLSTEDCLIPK